MINTTKPTVQNGKQERMKIQGREELKIVKEKERDKKRNQQMTMQSVYLIACEALVLSNKSTVSQDKYLQSKRNHQKIQIYLTKLVLIEGTSEIRSIIGMDRFKMAKDLAIDSTWHKNSDNNRKRGQKRREFYLLLSLTDSIIYSY